MRTITVKRKSHKVKGHYSHSKKGKREYVRGYKAKASSFRETENLPKKRNRVVPMPLKKGDLGGKGFFSKPEATRHRILDHAVAVFGYKHVLGKLNVIAVLDKRRDPSVSREAAKEREWLVKNFGGRAHGYDLHRRR